MNKRTEAIRKMSDKELAAAIAEKKETARAFRFGIAGSKTRNVKEGGNARKEVARLLTEVRSRTGKNA